MARIRIQKRVKMDRRIAFFIPDTVLLLMKRLIALRKENKNYLPVLADLYREALILGLHELISVEQTIYDEARTEEERQ